MLKGFDILHEGLSRWKLPFNQETVGLFEKYLKTLLGWNEKMNITSIDSLDEVVIFHFLDSLSVLLTDKIEQNARVIDIGSGGGFPGVPVKMMRPDIELTLVDSSKKRVAFLEHLIEELKLKNATAIHRRAEDLGRDYRYRESFCIALSRAVAQLSVLSEYCIPLIALGGFFIAHKGPGVEDELMFARNALKRLGASEPLLMRTDIFQSEKTHNLLIIEKISKTPEKYPRIAGTPKKSPL